MAPVALRSVFARRAGLALGPILLACQGAAPGAQTGPAAPSAGPSAHTAPGSHPRRSLPIWEPLQDELPAFTEPGPGARAPTNEAYGARLGESTLADVRALTAGYGAACQDRSARASAQAAREAKAREVVAAQAAGRPVDAVSGASKLLYRSPKELSPQVRLTCDAIDLASVHDRARPPLTPARLLFVFDSPAHPLRQASVQRQWPAARAADALEDLRQSLAALTAVYGAPTERRGELPDRPVTDAEAKAVPPLTQFQYLWRFADLQVRLGATAFPQGLAISEDVETPSPVRPDAAARAPSPDTARP